MSLENALKAAGVVRDAGGRVVGRTRLQKIAYLLSVTGLEQGLTFRYKHYGPFSEDLAAGARVARLLGHMEEHEQQASWGGTYSTYLAPTCAACSSVERRQLASEAAAADAVELELAATAVFLFNEGYTDAWGETARRKPEKAEGGGIDRARGLLGRLAAIQTPVRLPAI